MILSSIIREKYGQFLSLCKKHKVVKLYAFGSSITNQFNPQESDIDLVVDLEPMDPIENGETLISLWDNLESFFKRKVDMLTERSIKNPYLKKNIDSTKILIYDGQKGEILI